MSRRRTESEPTLSIHSGSYTRERVRKSDLAYEKGKDKLAHWIGAWGQDEVSRTLSRENVLFSAHHNFLCFLNV